ncbi:MAG: Crp/Fnr family transcriptional regulator [Candidatus Bipolaricaulota bacterium]
MNKIEKFELGRKTHKFDQLASFLASSVKGLTKSDFREIKDSLICVDYEGGDLIAQEGSLLSGVFIVYSGLVKIGKYSPSNKKRVLRFLAPGEWFGLETMFLKEQNRNVQFARALIDSELIHIESHAFSEFLDDHNELLFELCRWLAREVAMLEFKLTRHSTEGALQNLSLLLLALNEKYGAEKQDSSEIDLELSRKTLADLMGVSVETLRRLIRKLKQNEIIEMSKNRITIIDREGLSGLAETPEFYVDLLRDTL